MQRLVISVLLVFVGLSSLAFAEEWHQFRGPNANGVSQNPDLPVQWNAEKNLQWKVEIPGQGWSQPVVWGDKVFVTSAAFVEGEKPQSGRGERQRTNRPRNRQRGGGGPGGRYGDKEPPKAVYRWELYCLDRTKGNILWQETLHEGRPSIATHHSNTYASETPVTDGERVYVYFGMTGLYCYDMDGKQLWTKNPGTFPMQAGWGTSSSPALEGDLLFLQIDNEQESFLIAYDKKSGEERWRVDRDERSNWSSPIIWKNQERTELVTGGRTVRAYNPQDGQIIWELNMDGGRSAATPAGNEEMLIVGTEERNRGGYDDGGGTIYSVKAGASGNITPNTGETTSEGVLWSRPKSGLQAASPLIYDGYVYVLTRRAGMVSCYDAKTGEPAYQRKRIPGARAFWASPWAYGGKVFCLDDSGTTHVLKTGTEFEVLDKNMLDEQCWASSAITGDTVILRGVDHVYSFKK